MRSVLISIQPKWCNLIARGKKTVEVRKTHPKLETPFKCYIYCTKSKKYGRIAELDKVFGGGMVIGEFTCSKICAVLAHPSIFAGHPMFFQYAIDAACLTQDEVEAYGGGKDVYGWVISDLKIYDDYKEVTSFGLTKAPQSWRYVEEIDYGSN